MKPAKVWAAKCQSAIDETLLVALVEAVRAEMRQELETTIMAKINAMPVYALSARMGMRTAAEIVRNWPKT